MCGMLIIQRNCTGKYIETTALTFSSYQSTLEHEEDAKNKKHTLRLQLYRPAPHFDVGLTSLLVEVDPKRNWGKVNFKMYRNISTKVQNKTLYLKYDSPVQPAYIPGFPP